MKLDRWLPSLNGWARRGSLERHWHFMVAAFVALKIDEQPHYRGSTVPLRDRASV